MCILSSLYVFGLTNAPAVVMDSMNRFFHQFLDLFMIVFLFYILVYCKTKEDYVYHLRPVLQTLKISSCMLSSLIMCFG